MIPYGIILSAGESKRMGEFKPLLQLPGSETFLSSIVMKLLLVCDRIFIITGHREKDITSAISRLIQSATPVKYADGISETSDISGRIHLVHNPGYREGMFTSLRTGVTQLPEKNNAFLYHLIDQPLIPREFYIQLKKNYQRFSEEYDWIQPRYKGRGGHPVVLMNKTITYIREAEASVPLYEIKRKSDIRTYTYDCGFPEVLHDFDTPADLKEQDIPLK